MFTVTLVNLAPDLSGAQPDLGATELGPIDESQLLAVLDVFRNLDPVQNSEAEPHLVIESTVAKLLVRTGGGRLFVYNARNLSEPYAELEPVAILGQLGRHLAAPETAPVASPARHRRHRGLAIGIIALALALDSYTLIAFLRVRPVSPLPPVTFVADATAVEGARQSAAGRYATGAEPGDRIIEIFVDGRIRFLRLTASGQRTISETTSHVAKHDGNTCLVTATDGLIDIQNIYTIVYCRDTYRRAR